MQAAGHAVQRLVSPRDARQPVATFGSGAGVLDGLPDGVANLHRGLDLDTAGRDAGDAVFQQFHDGAVGPFARHAAQVRSFGAHVKQVAPEPCTADRPGVIRRIGNADHTAQQRGEHLACRHVGRQQRVIVKLRPQRDRISHIASPDQRAHGAIDRAVQRDIEVFGFKDFLDPRERLVIGQDRAQQGLFRLDIRGPVAQRRAKQGSGAVHDWPPAGADCMGNG
ncbi:hypothetical protein MSKU3_3307 [Komagataeibacter oboediens]|nr:hypothetical protein MSKU3_3307 [Komagataeibacter oboediens]